MIIKSSFSVIPENIKAMPEDSSERSEKLIDFFFHSRDLIITHLKSKIKAITPSFGKVCAAKAENMHKLVSDNVFLPSCLSTAEMMVLLDCIVTASNIFASCIKIVRNKSLWTDFSEIMMCVTGCE